uniref:Fe2OG dioxygenase domain-containing protein n=1 Tax=Quercus lobata TaxID=97700 RepID=A0A7N2N0E7_QUELO
MVTGFKMTSITLPIQNEPLWLCSQSPGTSPHEAGAPLRINMSRMSNILCNTLHTLKGLPADRFHGFFKDQTSYIRLNHYNPCPSPHLALGLGRHQDSGVLTILNEDDVGGLEVKRKTDGKWVRVKSTPDAYIINIGDTTQRRKSMQVWTNDEYESVEHRMVVNSERERMKLLLDAGASA